MLIFTSVLIGLMAILLFMPLRVIISYESKKAELKLKFGLFEFKPKSKSKLRGKKAKSDERALGKEKQDDNLLPDKITNMLSAFYETSGAVKRAVRIERLEFSAVYGSGDAAATGFLVGIAYAEIYKLIGIISCVFTVVPPVITISPYYGDDPKLDIDFHAIVKTNAAKAIYTAVKFIKKYKSYK